VDTETRPMEARPEAVGQAVFGPIRRKELYVSAVAIALGCVIWRLPPLDGMEPRGMQFFATMVVAIVLWVADLIEDYVVGLLLLLSWVVLDIVPAKVALGGFATDSWFFTIGALGIAAAIGDTMLLRRLAFQMLRRIPINCQRTYYFFLLLAGMFSGPLLPTGKARVAVAIPVSQAVIEASGFGPRSNGSAALSLAAFIGFSQMSFMFLTGAETCLIGWNFLPAHIKADFGWLSWLLVALPVAVGIILMMFVSIQLLLPLSGQEKATLTVKSVESTLALEPMSQKEKLIVVILTLTVAGWLTVPFHGINEAWVALAAVLAFLLTGALDKASFRNKLDWGLILFFGVLNSLTVVTHQLKVDASLRSLSEGFLGQFSGGPYTFLVLVFVLVVFVRFFLRKSATTALFAVTLLPFSESVGIHPGVIVIAAITIAECFILGYQDGPYQIAYAGFSRTAFSHGQARKILAAKYGATFLALLISVPYWRLLGLIR
jgi:divalent anion:Na+ symporter, DASS family